MDTSKLKVGDRVRVDGYGTRHTESVAVESKGDSIYLVNLIWSNGVFRCTLIGGNDLHIQFRLSSIIEIIPAREEPKVGEWDCSANMVHPGPGFHLQPCKVYRSTGWSKDERMKQRRVGLPWVFVDGDKVCPNAEKYDPMTDTYTWKLLHIQRRKSDRRASR